MKFETTRRKILHSGDCAHLFRRIQPVSPRFVIVCFFLYSDANHFRHRACSGSVTLSYDGTSRLRNSTSCSSSFCRALSSTMLRDGLPKWRHSLLQFRSVWRHATESRVARPGNKKEFITKSMFHYSTRPVPRYICVINLLSPPCLLHLDLT